jgi:hypothetical protein
LKVVQAVLLVLKQSTHCAEGRPIGVDGAGPVVLVKVPAPPVGRHHGEVELQLLRLQPVCTAHKQCVMSVVGQGSERICMCALSFRGLEYETELQQLMCCVTG